MICAIAVAIPVMVFAIEVVSATFNRPGAPLGPVPAEVAVAVLIPAHNEAQGILATLQDVQKQLRPMDRIVVVADNCSDDTAAVARAAGAEVIVRNDSIRTGKGYALDFGIRWLEGNPPDVVIVLDADCRLAANAVGALASAVMQSSKPAQACDLMLMNASGETVGSKVGEFAWRIKNQVRPGGLAVLKMPCQLAGTGMAFPWHLIQSAPLASGSLAEDLELGLKLAAAGDGALFCPAAVVWSTFAETEAGARSQRARWEQGHLQTIRELFWRTLVAGIRRRNIGAIALALDLSVPPLSFLGFLLLGSLMFSAFVAAVSIGSAPLLLSLAALVVFAVAIWLSWHAVGRDIIPAAHAGSLVLFALGKTGLYSRILFTKTDKRWVRTDRNRR
jgi:cellulose synthase/poly-beta-1,6-N-acetylglucosamine synthase-like glycosyltransferase